MVSETEGRFSDSQTAVQYFVYSAASASFRQYPISAYLGERNFWEFRLRSSDFLEPQGQSSDSSAYWSRPFPGWLRLPREHHSPQPSPVHLYLLFPAGGPTQTAIFLQNRKMSVRFFLDSNLLNLHKVCLYSMKISIFVLYMKVFNLPIN